MIVQASFYFRNDAPDGLGLTFGPSGFTPEELTSLFAGDTVKQYFRDSDAHLGTRIVDDYLRQLEGIAAEAKLGPLSMAKALMAALNVYWLTERGFLPQDEFNGTLFVYQR